MPKASRPQRTKLLLQAFTQYWHLSQDLQKRQKAITKRLQVPETNTPVKLAPLARDPVSKVNLDIWLIPSVLFLVLGLVNLCLVACGCFSTQDGCTLAHSCSWPLHFRCYDDEDRRNKEINYISFLFSH
jgi:hypothetical protein